MSIMTMYQHDTIPDLEATLTGTVDGVTAPVDLTTALSIKALGSQNGSALFSRTVTGNASGVIVMPWQASDTAAPGVVTVEFEVTWVPGKVQTFRAGKVVVLRDLG